MHPQQTLTFQSQLNFHSSSKIYDLSVRITPQTTVFPGATPFSSETLSSLQQGHKYGLCKLQLANHIGTHVDYPLHLFENGKSSSDYKLEDLRGKGIIVEVPHSMKKISKQFIQQLNIQENDIVFFKTFNSQIPKTGPVNPNFAYVDPQAAEQLVLKKPKMVGIDYLSIDGYHEEELPSHKILLSKQILIVQGLELNLVPSGRYFINVAPINIANMDGVPARVFCYV